MLVIELAELNHLLADARQQLIGFLTLAEPWATDHVPQLAESLIAALDEHLRITQPLTSSQPFNDPPAIPDSRG
ncbi:hypothetical protein ACRB68_18060 [Actinomadura sp. RB68]|uniref:Uncharacterized protein n=1 Tax=Actinomadura macrotermitis TaxID=2585200 RepID=A0A7K0BRI8_9ACTN|nr:hypothetical protein [Actinomadura macrotermitis]